MLIHKKGYKVLLNTCPLAHLVVQYMTKLAKGNRGEARLVPSTDMLELEQRISSLFIVLRYY